MRLLIGFLAVLGLCAHVPAFAAPLPSDPLERKCWLSTARDRLVPDLRDTRSVHFTNLHDNAHLATPFRLHFGIRGMGIAPAGNPIPDTGHHHVLLDTPLPIDVQTAIPFSDRYRHFGKGYTETVLDLPPGKHTLRLLFADHEHKPYFVYSKEIAIWVDGRRDQVETPKIDPARFAETCQRWIDYESSRPPAKDDTRPYVANVRSGETVSSPVLLTLGVAGLGIAPAQAKIASTGYFVIDDVAVDRRGARVAKRIPLAGGANETVLDLAQGPHALRVSFTDITGKTIKDGEELQITVAGETPGF